MFKRIFYILLGVLVWGNASCAKRNLVISDIQLGYEENRTRIALTLSQPINLYVRVEANSGDILIEAPEDTVWDIPFYVNEAQGNFQSYTLNSITESPRLLRLSFSPGTSVAGYSLEPTPVGQYQFLIDIVTEEPAPEPEPEPEMPMPEPAPVQIMAPAPTIVVNPMVEIPTPPANKITAVKVVEQKDETTWVSITSTAREYFNFDSLPHEKKILIYVPKTNWVDVDTHLKSSPLVRTYRVQDTDPNFSVVSIETYRENAVIDEFMSPNSDGSNDFVLVIADRLATDEEKGRLKQKKQAETLNTLHQEKIALQAKLQSNLIEAVQAKNSENPEFSAGATSMPVNENGEQSSISASSLGEVGETAAPNTSVLGGAGPLFDADTVSGVDGDAPVDSPTDTPAQEPEWVLQAKQEAQSIQG
ncbi:MAG: hypothetical protein WCG05_03285 [Alphaproteobacteria bacterium]